MFTNTGSREKDVNLVSAVVRICTYNEILRELSTVSFVGGFIPTLISASTVHVHLQTAIKQMPILGRNHTKDPPYRYPSIYLLSCPADNLVLYCIVSNCDDRPWLQTWITQTKNQGLVVSSLLQRHNTENSKQTFPEKELCRLSPNFHILWAIYIFQWLVCLFCCRKICGPILGVLHSLCANFYRTPAGYTADRKTRRKRNMGCVLLSVVSSPPHTPTPLDTGNI